MCKSMSARIRCEASTQAQVKYPKAPPVRMNMQLAIAPRSHEARMRYTSIVEIAVFVSFARQIVNKKYLTAKNNATIIFYRSLKCGSRGEVNNNSNMWETGADADTEAEVLDATTETNSVEIWQAKWKD